MGCGCHAAKKVSAANKQVVKKDRTIARAILSNAGHNVNGVRKIIRRSISH